VNIPDVHEKLIAGFTTGSANSLQCIGPSEFARVTVCLSPGGDGFHERGDVLFLGVDDGGERVLRVEEAL